MILFLIRLKLSSIHNKFKYLLTQYFSSKYINQNSCRQIRLIRARICSAYFPVSSFGASTGFDSGEPFCRRKIEKNTIAATDKNSLCQFCNDSNQNLFSKMVCQMVSDFPSSSFSSNIVP